MPRRSVERGAVASARAAEGLGRASGAADFVPAVESLVHPCVHNGFWKAYATIRREILAEVDAALDGDHYSRVLVTGHSLGGALAMLASADIAVNCLKHRPQPPRLSCVTFGSPRVGNHVWARTFDDLVPDAYRVVTDGDIVASVPRLFFSHCGTAVIVDPRAQSPGFLIVDPSFIEKRLALSFSRKLAPHKLSCYVRGLWGAAGAFGDEPPDTIDDVEPRDLAQTTQPGPAPPPRTPRAPCCAWFSAVTPATPNVDPTPLLQTPTNNPATLV